jgi:hypothetical protein
VVNIVTLLKTQHGKRPDTTHGEQSFWVERGAEYAEKFFAGVRRWLDEPAQLWFLTDTPEATPAGVVPIALPARAGPGWWAKLEMFEPTCFGHKTLYSDLDNVVCGPLAPILALEPDPIIMADDIIHPSMPNGSVFLCYPERLEHLWAEYHAQPDAMRLAYQEWPKAADQAYIADRVPQPIALFQQLLPPGTMLNARAELENGAGYSGTSLVFGSWHPKPHESSHPFYVQHWRA